MATEEQTTTNTNTAVGHTDSRAGQKLTISDRVVTKLSFRLFKDGAPAGAVTYTIRKVSDDSIIVSKVLDKDASALGSIPGLWEEVTFDTEHRIDEEVYLLCEFTGGDLNNSVRVSVNVPSVKAGEHVARYVDAGAAYTEQATWDAGYIYTYGGTPGSTIFPTEAITRVTNIIHRYIRKERVYTMEVSLGEVTTDFGLPEWAGEAMRAAPREEPKIGRELPTYKGEFELSGLLPAYPGMAPHLTSQQIAALGKEIADIRMGRIPMEYEAARARLQQISRILEGLESYS